jgi:aspartate aminotransferase
MISKKIKNINPSATVELTSKIAELKRKGVDILTFNVGEPDFATPENIKVKAKEGLDLGLTKYTPAPGTIELREEISKKLSRDNNVNYNYDEIIVSNGAKHSLINTLMTLCNEGDEVVIPSPFWVSYIEMVKLAGGVPVIVEMDEKDNFDLNIEKIKDSISDKTKCIMINTPNNPTGAVYSKEKLKEIGRLAVDKDIYIIADDIYEKLIYDGEKHISIASLSEEIKNHTVLINGVSKAYAMTGWRIGYAAGPREIIKAMTTLQGHMTSGANTNAQYAAVEALKNSEESVKVMVDEFDKRRKYLVERLKNIKDVSCNVPKGAFYAMPNVSKLFGKSYDGRKINNSEDLADYLLDEAKIAVVPGIAFGIENNIRIAYSNSIENIEKGMDRMKEAVEKLK